METLKKKTWIYWRWKNDSDSGKSLSLSASYVQDIIKSAEGNIIIELTDHEFYTNYPHRVLLKEIEIV